MRALLSVYDKTGIIELAQGLIDRGWEIISTGGTLTAIAGAGLPVQPVSDVTGFPEILDGRVKTLHPKVHGGLLARRDLPEHISTLATHEITPIDLLAVNLYPFETTVQQPGITDLDAIEQIDIGGPAMLRSAAKNFADVVVLSDPEDYTSILNRLSDGQVDLTTRRALAAKAFTHVSTYDALVAAFLRQDEQRSPEWPRELSFAARHEQTLRYGENPSQRAAVYRRLMPGRRPIGLLDAQQLGGKELSFNNLLDADAAWNTILTFEEPAASVIKHTIPCGLALGTTLTDAFNAALAGDPVSAFGGIVALNRTVDRATAERLTETFFEVIVAPGFDDDALAILTRKKQLRLLAMPTDAAGLPRQDHTLDIRLIRGGLLLQDRDDQTASPEQWQTVTTRAATVEELRDLQFAWEAVRHVKSNAIVLVKDRAVIGVGSGQPNRVESVRIAVAKAGDRAQGSVLASDAFFPFADGLEVALAAGVTAAVQPGGSIRDDEVIAAADRVGAAMLVTGVRHFRH